MVAQPYLHPSALSPTSGKIGVHCETPPDTFCAKIQLTSEKCKNNAGPAQYCFIHFVQFDGAPCKTDSLGGLLRYIYHPQVLFSDNVDHSSCCISRSESLIQVDCFAEIGKGCVSTRLRVLHELCETPPVAVVGVQVCSRLSISPFNLCRLHIRHQLAHDPRRYLVLKLKHIL